jgi:hypothetical protein
MERECSFVDECELKKSDHRVDSHLEIRSSNSDVLILIRSFGHRENNKLKKMSWYSFVGKVTGYEMVQTGYEMAHCGSIPAVVVIFSSHAVPRFRIRTDLPPL